MNFSGILMYKYGYKGDGCDGYVHDISEKRKSCVQRTAKLTLNQLNQKQNKQEKMTTNTGPSKENNNIHHLLYVQRPPAIQHYGKQGVC